MGKTLFEKVWSAHVVKELDGGMDVLYIDRHLIHEVTSPQAFSELEKRGLSLFRKEKMVATPDHNIPTKNQHLPIKEGALKTSGRYALGQLCETQSRVIWPRSSISRHCTCDRT